MKPAIPFTLRNAELRDVGSIVQLIRDLAEFEQLTHLLDVMRLPSVSLGIIPMRAATTIWEKGKAATFDTARIDAIEAEVKHDVIAFLTHLAEIVGPEARFVHQGMTSSDVLDTCLSVQLARSADLLIEGMDKVLPGDEKASGDNRGAGAGPTGATP